MSNIPYIEIERASCGYCYAPYGTAGNTEACRVIQVRAMSERRKRGGGWHAPIAACRGCRAYLFESVKGDVRYAPPSDYVVTQHVTITTRIETRRSATGNTVTIVPFPPPTDRLFSRTELA